MLRRFRAPNPVDKLDRLPKALMIDAIVEAHLGRPVTGMDLLDIGCGNGGISRYFAGRENRVASVDVQDRRKGRAEPFLFKLVDSPILPFDNGSFDIVLSHHVIEHLPDQSLHLQEIHRVLRPGGVCYMATPNRTSPIMKGHIENDMVLRYLQMRPLFERHGFSVREYSTDVVTEPDRFHYPIRAGRIIPRFVANCLRPLFPSHIFVPDRQTQA
jgi:SAM-dependent methyltransferase